MTAKEKLDYLIPYLKEMVKRGDDEAKLLLKLIGE